MQWRRSEQDNVLEPAGHPLGFMPQPCEKARAGRSSGCAPRVQAVRPGYSNERKRLLWLLPLRAAIARRVRGIFYTRPQLTRESHFRSHTLAFDALGANGCYVVRSRDARPIYAQGACFSILTLTSRLIFTSDTRPAVIAHTWFFSCRDRCCIGNIRKNLRDRRAGRVCILIENSPCLLR